VTDGLVFKSDTFQKFVANKDFAIRSLNLERWALHFSVKFITLIGIDDISLSQSRPDLTKDCQDDEGS